MKANMIKILLEGCDKDLLMKALSLLTETTQQNIFSLATGDVKFYDNYSLPKPSKENIIKLVVKKTSYEVVDIKSIEVIEFCSQIRVSYIFNTYRWYKTEEEANANDRTSSMSYSQGDYKFKGIKPTEDSTNTIIDIDTWLAYTNACNE